jgi:hypothetical protein
VGRGRRGQVRVEEGGTRDVVGLAEGPPRILQVLDEVEVLFLFLRHSGVEVRGVSKLEEMKCHLGLDGSKLREGGGVATGGGSRGGEPSEDEHVRAEFEA